jgi:hypothetical protein
MVKYKYKVGDVVGCCGDAMYEMKIIRPIKGKKAYEVKCVKVHSERSIVSVGDKFSLPEKRIVTKLN